MSIVSTLLSADEFGRMPDPGHPQELVRGVIVNMPPPRSRHGQICVNIVFQLRTFLEGKQLGHVVANDTGVITERDPDTVRGMDVAFFSFAKVPPGPLPNNYFEIAPDAVFEVRSPSDRWTEIHRKVSEYLTLGAQAVYVLDPDTTTVRCYFPDRPDEVLNSTDELVGIGSLSGFRLPVAKLFE